MAVLESCPKHNMVAYLEKTAGNAEFHECGTRKKEAETVSIQTHCCCAARKERKEGKVHVMLYMRGIEGDTKPVGTPTVVRHNSEKKEEEKKCLKIVTFEGTIDSEVMEKKSFISKLDKVSSPEGDYLVIYKANGNFRAFNYLLEKKMIKVISGVINKEVVTWRLYEACGVYILELKDGTVIHMLVERRYPLSKDLLQRMLDLRLEVNEKCTVP
ncbi:hypothetical protein Tco_1265952 [Tanacetum coccineum]